MSDTPAVSTVQVIDPRIEPQPEPVYANTIGPDQNQFYKIPASGISDSYVTFNNLTTLGKDRAYLDTFELEITVDVTFHSETSDTNYGIAPPMHGYFMPLSFPFNSVCEQARVNINGGAFFNSPMATIRAKERYWDDEKLQESFANHTPCQKPFLQDELCVADRGAKGDFNNRFFSRYRTRMFGSHMGFGSRANGPLSTTNFSILPNYDMHLGSEEDQTVTIVWREPIFCSPFSSRYDATYGRPLYNITSIDLAFNLVDLRNMFLVCSTPMQKYEVHLRDIQLCYQVLTVTAPLNHSFTVIPYRRYVPYITDGTADSPGRGVQHDLKITSGVYTLNEVPTAIWIFLAPALSEYQRFNWDGMITEIPSGSSPQGSFFDSTSRHTNNKLFGFLKHISISCGNTTQILNTASIYDLYRIAKANGCKDSFEDWAVANPFDEYNAISIPTEEGDSYPLGNNIVPGCGSVLRLIPGTDIVLPEQKLTPGANANNLVFQVEATFDYVGLGNRDRRMSLWLLFEYVGVASITPGNCVVTMNPLGNGAIMAAAPTISGTSSENEAAPSTTEGSGWLDKIKSALGVANKLAKDTKIVSSALKYIPGVGEIASNIASQFGYGYKRPRLAAAVADSAAGAIPGGSLSGGAVMGLGDFC